MSSQLDQDWISQHKVKQTARMHALTTILSGMDDAQLTGTFLGDPAKMAACIRENYNVYAACIYRALWELQNKQRIDWELSLEEFCESSTQESPDHPDTWQLLLMTFARAARIRDA